MSGHPAYPPPCRGRANETLILLVAGLFSMVRHGAAPGRSGRRRHARRPAHPLLRTGPGFRPAGLFDREKGRPMKVFEEDGSNGSRITNHIIRRVLRGTADFQPEKAEAFGRATATR